MKKHCYESDKKGNRENINKKTEKIKEKQRRKRNLSSNLFLKSIFLQVDETALLRQQNKKKKRENQQKQKKGKAKDKKNE